MTRPRPAPDPASSRAVGLAAGRTAHAEQSSRGVAGREDDDAVRPPARTLTRIAGVGHSAIAAPPAIETFLRIDPSRGSSKNPIPVAVRVTMKAENRRALTSRPRRASDTASRRSSGTDSINWSRPRARRRSTMCVPSGAMATIAVECADLPANGDVWQRTIGEPRPLDRGAGARAATATGHAAERQARRRASRSAAQPVPRAPARRARRR